MTFVPLHRHLERQPKLPPDELMNKNKTMKIIALLCLFVAKTSAQELTQEERITKLEQKTQEQTEKQAHSPKIHGIMRGKYEYEPDLEASRFEVRNARLSVESQPAANSNGGAKLSPAYKLEIDLCDEGQIKMKDAWVRLAIALNEKKGGFLRATVGQQRMPFSIDAHRNPSAQYFANRSFIAKQVGDMRDVGFQLGYDWVDADGRKIAVLDAGIFNGSNLDNQKTAWFTSPSYSARLQWFPVKEWAIIPSIQHQKIAERKASYTSLDLGTYYERPLPSSPSRGGVLHLEAEYLHKIYQHDAFADCNALDVMAIYRQTLGEKNYFEGVSYLLRYDYMDDHSDGKKGVNENNKLQISDYARHRLTAGLTFHVRNSSFPTDLRLNYEKYWYADNGIAKESEQDKLVCELMIRF